MEGTPATVFRRSQGLCSAVIPERLWGAWEGYSDGSGAGFSLAEEDSPVAQMSCASAGLKKMTSGQVISSRFLVRIVSISE